MFVTNVSIAVDCCAIKEATISKGSGVTGLTREKTDAENYSCFHKSKIKKLSKCFTRCLAVLYSVSTRHISKECIDENAIGTLLANWELSLRSWELQVKNGKRSFNIDV